MEDTPHKKIKFSIKNYFSNCRQIRSFLKVSDIFEKKNFRMDRNSFYNLVSESFYTTLKIEVLLIWPLACLAEELMTIALNCPHQKFSNNIDAFGSN